jgi:2-oxoglutarate ferredoxin oxidoreductase subunit gamma
MQHRCLFAGFGGQGILSMGQIIANAGMVEGYRVTFYPLYGVAVRGGLANCTVVISDEEITSPIVCHPTVMVTMDKASYDSFEPLVAPDGLLFVNSSLVSHRSARKDIRAVYVNATGMALEKGDGRVANMVMLGAVLKLTRMVPLESVEKAMKKAFSLKLHPLIPRNMEAIRQGYEI